MLHQKPLSSTLAISTALWLAVSSPAQQPNYDQLAKRIVQTSAAIKPGEVVIIAGGKHNLPLMESLAIEANKAGGMTTMFISTDRVDRSFNVDVPEKYLDQEPRFFAEWIKQVNVYIGLPGEENPKAVIAGVPEGRFARVAKAGQAIGEMIMKGPGLRAVFIGYPTQEDAAAYQMDFNAYSKMHWDAVDTDYNAIAVKRRRYRRRCREPSPCTLLLRPERISRLQWATAPCLRMTARSHPRS
jgi:leucyl aminopeptidase (aminopeptidase T)